MPDQPHLEEPEPKDPGQDFLQQIQDAISSGRVQTFFTQMQEEEAHAEPPASPAEEESELLQRIRAFNLRPREVKDYLDRFVIQQDHAKKVLSVAICDHYNHVRTCLSSGSESLPGHTKQNVLLLGPTGVGKTYLMRCIARLIGVPFVKADATKFSETGYVGSDVEDLVRDLVKLADGDLNAAQYGIIYIDEIDKIAASSGSGSKDVSGRGVQVNLLKLMEDSDVNLFSQTDLIGQMQAMMHMQRGGEPPARTINTRHILFIVSGAFDKLEEIIARRLEGSRIGFGPGHSHADQKQEHYLHKASAADFIEYGFEPEFVGRLPVRAACDHLSPKDLETILLTAEDSLLQQVTRDFKGYSIDFDITREAVSEIAKRAYQEKTGARGLMTVFEEVLRGFKYELPSTSIRHFELDEQGVHHPIEALGTLLAANQSSQDDYLAGEVHTYAQRFKEEQQLSLIFEPGAIEALVRMSLDTGKTVRTLCEQLFNDYQFGLQLISERTGQTEFTITAAAVAHPDQELSSWVINSYQASS